MTFFSICMAMTETKLDISGPNPMQYFILQFVFPERLLVSQRFPSKEPS
jgi:hypothetical protein